MRNSMGPDANFYVGYQHILEMNNYEDSIILDSINEEIDEHANIGAIYELRKIIPENIPQYIDYVEPEKVIQYDEMLHNEIEKYDQEEIYSKIWLYFLDKHEIYSKETLNKIITLLVNHKCIEFWEYFFTNHINTKPIIKSFYDKFVQDTKDIYRENKVNNKEQKKHECIDYKFMELKPLKNHRCIICGQKYCEIIDVD